MLSVGCGQQSGGSEPESVGALPAELVTTLELSPTHTLKFWDYGDGLTRIEENYDMDLDRDAALTLRKVDISGRSLASVYATFAGAHADPVEAAKIEQLDLRTAALARQNIASAEPAITEELAPQSGTVSLSRASSEQSLASGSDVGVRQEAVVACTEPSNDWAADVGWFKTNFCGNDSWWCPTEVGWADTGWSPYLTAYSSAGENMSFCTTASYKVMYRSKAGGSGGIVEASLVNMTLPTRWVNNNSWTTPSGGHIRYWSRIQSTLDNRVALAIHRTEL